MATTVPTWRRLSFHEEVVDEHRLTRCGRCHGQLGLAGEHIDEARLTYIRSTDKCILRLPVLWAFVQTGITNDKLCALYLHGYYCLLVMTAKVTIIREIEKFRVGTCRNYCITLY